MPQPFRIEEATAVIDPVFLDTPVARSEALNQKLGREIVLKVETLTPIRSFKGRGASYLMHRLGDAARTGAVVASTGNFGQGLAHACRGRGVPVTVFSCMDANPLKLEAMRRLGAEIRLQGHDFDAAKLAAREYAAASGRFFVEDGADPAVAEGAGTIALEMDRADALGDVVLLALGNGSLINGVGSWVKAHRPGTRVVGVAAAGAPSMYLSWREGRVVETPSVATIAEGIAIRVPVPEAVAAMRLTVDDVVLVEDAVMIEGMRLAFDTLGLVVEATGAVGLAALLAHPDLGRGLKVSTILCGGNVTAEQARDWLLDPSSASP
jgi:threonine dehydratase